MTDSPFALNGKHIVVVGASSGIGLAVARRCADAGAKVSLCARRTELLAEVTPSLAGSGHGWQALDAREARTIGPAFDRLVAERGPIDGLVYAAKLSIGTLLVALLCFAVLKWPMMGNFVLVYPEAHLFTIALFILLGRYAGYRLTELWRFRDLVESGEVVR